MVGFAPATGPADFLYGCLEAPVILNICRCDNTTSAGNAMCGTANQPFVLWRFTFRPLAARSVLGTVSSDITSQRPARPPTAHADAPRDVLPYVRMNEPPDSSPHSGPGRSVVRRSPSESAQLRTSRLRNSRGRSGAPKLWLAANNAGIERKKPVTQGESGAKIRENPTGGDHPRTLDGVLNELMELRAYLQSMASELRWTHDTDTNEQ